MPKRIQALQALRGIAFLLIFCSHCTFINGFASAWGAIGVSIFIVLSGFVITFNQKFRNDDYKLKTIPYTIKRLSKIFPLHLIMLLIRIVYDYLLYGVVTSVPIILLNITMLKSFIPVRDIYYSMGGATWYLTLVWLFALLTPLLLKILKILLHKKCCLITFILIVTFRIGWIYFWHLDDAALWWNYVNPLFRVTDYFIGMILGANIRSIEKIINKRKGVYCGCAIFIWLIFGTYLIAMSANKLPWYNIYFRTLLSICVIVLFVNSNQENKILRMLLYENKFLIFIGNISFEMFLIHIHVRNIILYKFNEINPFILLIFIFACSVILSQIYFNLDCKIRAKIKEHKREDHRK